MLSNIRAAKKAMLTNNPPNKILSYPQLPFNPDKLPFNPAIHDTVNNSDEQDIPNNRDTKPIDITIHGSEVFQYNKNYEKHFQLETSTVLYQEIFSPSPQPTVGMN